MIVKDITKYPVEFLKLRGYPYKIISVEDVRDYSANLAYKDYHESILVKFVSEGKIHNLTCAVDGKYYKHEHKFDVVVDVVGWEMYKLLSE